MNATTPSRDLSAALKRVKRAMPGARCPIPVLHHVRVVATPGAGDHLPTVSVMGTDAESFCRVTLSDVTVDAPLDVVVPFDKLAKLATKAPAATVTLSDVTDRALNEETTPRIRVTSGKLAATLDGIHTPDALHYPVAPDHEDVPCVLDLAGGDPATLADVFTRTAFAMSTEETRYYLRGVYLHATSAGTLRAAATDGHRCAVLDTDITADPGRLERGVILPAADVKACGEILTDKRGAPSAYLRIHAQDGRGRFWLARGGVEWSGKLVDGGFPDYSRIVPDAATLEHRVTLDRAATIEGVTLLDGLSDARGPAIQIDAGDDDAPGVMRLRDPDSTYDLPAIAGTGRFLSAFNARYLLDALGAMRPDAVTLCANGPETPAVMAATGDPLVIVVMPMRR